MIKQIICVRADLKNKDGQKIRTGKIAAQVAHASMKVFFDRKMIQENHFCYLNKEMIIPLTKEMEEWIKGIFTKICLRVDSEQELDDIYNKAKEANLPCAMIIDSGKTEFNGVPTKTCVAIGPANSEDIDKITGHLKLL